MHRFDGAEQYFTRAVDFGFSFSIEETFEKWGREEIIGDFVRLIRTIRPDVIARHCGPTATAAGSTIRRRRSSRARRSSSPAIRRSIPEQIEGRPASLAAEEVLLPGAGSADRRRGRRRRRACRRRQPRASTIRCSARRTPRSAPRRAACTSARAWRSCWRCPGPSADDASSSSSRRLPGRLQRGRARRCSTASTPSIAGLAQFAGAAAAAGARPTGSRRSRPPCRTRRSGSTPTSDAGATLQPLLDRPARGSRAARRSCATMPIDESGALRDRVPAAPEGARVPAGDSRSPTASASKRSPTTASSCPASRSACRSSSPTAAPADVDSQAGERSRGSTATRPAR